MELLKEALKTLFENDASSARPEGSLEVRRMYWWQHNDKPRQLCGRIQRAFQKSVDHPQSFELTIFTLKETHEVAVVEMGTNHFGEIGRIASFVQPDYRLFLPTSALRIENFVCVRASSVAKPRCCLICAQAVA